MERTRHACCVVSSFWRKRIEKLVEIIGGVVVKEYLDLRKLMRTESLAFILVLQGINYVLHR